MIYFEAGGWCGDKDLDTTIENCYIRSLGSLGSSKSYPANYTVKMGFSHLIKTIISKTLPKFILSIAMALVTKAQSQNLSFTRMLKFISEEVI